MAYDPSLPANNAPVVSAELRSQFAGLKELIDASATPDTVQTAINNQTAGECRLVPILNLAVSDPPTQADVQAIADKLAELMAYLRRD